MDKKISTRQLLRNFSKTMAMVNKSSAIFVVTHQDQPRVVIAPVDFFAEYKNLQESVKKLNVEIAALNKTFALIKELGLVPSNKQA